MCYYRVEKNAFYQNDSDEWYSQIDMKVLVISSNYFTVSEIVNFCSNVVHDVYKFGITNLPVTLE